MTGHKDELTQELITLIRDKLCQDPAVTVQPQSQLFAERIIDSINILALMGFVEGKLGRRLRDDELVMPRFASVDAIVRTFFL
jgi:acyl carrier protein